MEFESGSKKRERKNSGSDAKRRVTERSGGQKKLVEGVERFDQAWEERKVILHKIKRRTGELEVRCKERKKRENKKSLKMVVERGGQECGKGKKKPWKGFDMGGGEERERRNWVGGVVVGGVGDRGRKGETI